MGDSSLASAFVQLLTLDDIDPQWRQTGRWRLGAALGTPGGMTVPVDTVFLHHTVSLDTGDVQRDVAQPCDYDQRKFGKVSYSWNVHESSGSIVEVEGTHRGAHTIDNRNNSFNGVAFGVGVIGNFQTNVAGVRTTTPSPQLVRLIADGIRAVIVDAGLVHDGWQLLSHSAVFSTACCGDLLRPLIPEIRRLVDAAPSPTPEPPTPTPIQEDEPMLWLVQIPRDLAVDDNEANAWQWTDLVSWRSWCHSRDEARGHIAQVEWRNGRVVHGGDSGPFLLAEANMAEARAVIAKLRELPWVGPEPHPV